MLFLVVVENKNDLQSHAFSFSNPHFLGGKMSFLPKLYKSLRFKRRLSKGKNEFKEGKIRYINISRPRAMKIHQ